MSKGQKDPTNNWPDGSTWVFQGTIAEDATAGTHVCTLTVIPGAANELQLLYGNILNGNTATAQVMAATIDDGSNNLSIFLNISDTAALISRNIPPLVAPVTNTSSYTTEPSLAFIISGTMRLILKVTTAAVSVTQTFGLVCRLRSPKLPTATLADTVGTPTLTTNTNKIFG